MQRMLIRSRHADSVAPTTATANPRNTSGGRRVVLWRYAALVGWVLLGLVLRGGVLPSPLLAQSLDEEARALAWEYFQQQRTACGETWLFGFDLAPVQNGFAQPLGAPGTWSTGNYLQMDKVTTQLLPTRLSAADTLNGLQWQGGVLFRATAYCFYDATGALSRRQGWTGWFDGGPIVRVSLTRKHGHWDVMVHVEGHLAAYGARLKASGRPDCQQVAALATRQIAPPAPPGTSVGQPSVACQRWERWDANRQQCVRWRANPYGG